MRRWNTDEGLRRLERAAAASGAKDDKVRLAAERIRVGAGPEQRIREILEQANQATFAMGRLIGLDVRDETIPFMALQFDTVRELVALTAGDPGPRLFAHAAMPVHSAGGRAYPVTLALAVRDVERDVVTVGVTTTGSPWSAPNHATLSSTGWWTHQDRTPTRGSINDRPREKRVWVLPEIDVYPGSLRPAPAARLTKIVIDWARRRYADDPPYAGSGITFPIHGLRVDIDLSEAELWSARQSDEATTDERIEVSDELWRIRNRGRLAAEDYVRALAIRPRVHGFAVDYVRQWDRFSARVDAEPLFPAAE